MTSSNSEDASDALHTAETSSVPDFFVRFPMSQVALDEPLPRRHRAWMTFIISFSAAVCMAGGFAIMAVALVFASAVLFDLSHALVWTLNGIIGIASLWGFVWVFSRSWHVEKDLGAASKSMTPKLR